MKSIAIYTVTREKIENTLIRRSYLDLHNNNIKFYYDENNKEGLSTMYNKFLVGKGFDHDIVIFAHDDVYIDDRKIVEKLYRAHDEYAIVGIAGGLNPRIQKPALWHLMCGGFGSGNLRGAVGHFLPNSSKLTVTGFGPTASRVAILDGVFISVDLKQTRKMNWLFNENYKFHHYDIASSLDANKLELKLGVAPIWCVHKSPGLLNINDESFQKSQEKFINEYS